MSRIILIIFTLISISGCVTPTTFGVSESEWRNYTPQQQKEMKEGYYQLLKSKVDGNDGLNDGSTVSVSLSGGKVNMPPFTQLYAYKPVQFQLNNQSCRNITLTELGGDKTVEVQACYRGKALYIDPSRYDISKRLGSIRLYYSPIWKRGFTYQSVSSSGYARLNNVDVAVKMVSLDEPVERENE